MAAGDVGDEHAGAGRAAAGVVAGLGGAVAIVVTGALTVRAFVAEGLGIGLLWLFVIAPVVILAAYLASLAIASKAVQLLRRARRR